MIEEIYNKPEDIGFKYLNQLYISIYIYSNQYNKNGDINYSYKIHLYPDFE